jgi:hypothetical protein
MWYFSEHFADHVCLLQAATIGLLTAGSQAGAMGVK